MNPLALILILILSLQAIAFVIAIVARVWVLRSETFVMRGIDVPRATDLVALYVQGVHDHRFGFPTGVFAVDEARTSPGRVFAREINFKGSAGMAPIMFGLKLPLLGLAAGAAMGADADDAGAGCMVGFLGAWMGFMLGAAAAVVLIVPFAFLALVEVILRMLMQGQIEASIEKDPELEDAVRVNFELRGLSAFGVEPQIRRGMAPPRPAGLPVAATSQPGEEKSDGRALDRLNTIYVAAVFAGALTCLVSFLSLGNLQASDPSASASGSPSSYQSSEAQYYEEEEAEEEEGESEAEQPEYEQPTQYEEARQTYLRYWKNIANGYYGAAYDIYYPTFATQQGVSRSEFVAAEETFSPGIRMRELVVSRGSRQPTSQQELWVYAEVPIRDRSGEFAGICRMFFGEARMFRDGGEWYYRPGLAFGREPSFGNSELGGGVRELSPSSPRCP